MDESNSEPYLLEYDAVGVVREIGTAVQGFDLGDRVWYAGDANRSGSYAVI